MNMTVRRGKMRMSLLHGNAHLKQLQYEAAATKQQAETGFNVFLYLQ